MEKSKKSEQALDKVIIVSKGGHKYELTVDDSGNLSTSLVKDDQNADSDA